MRRACGVNQIIKWSGSQWICSDETIVPSAYLQRLLIETRIAFTIMREPANELEIFSMRPDGSEEFLGGNWE